MSEQAKVIHATLPEVLCPDCHCTFAWEIHPRTGIQDRNVLICQNNGCKQFGHRWQSPTVKMIPAPPAPTP